MPEEEKYTNRLIQEKSPYLRQHAHNPVEWYPWGDEAFVEAAIQDKPIFLSIGYATCHWCHVMERESFENEDIAEKLNRTFINIKVDREELPYVDSLYMEFAQGMMQGSAGWPLNVLLTPELKPFFSTTYLPPKTSHGLLGLEELIDRIDTMWNSPERQVVVEQSSQIVQIFQVNKTEKGEIVPSRDLLDKTVELFFKISDPVYGGLKGSPKFPIGYFLIFLLKYASKTQESRALYIVEKSLDKMQQGGIYDHIGGGFCRYSVDEQWLTPHFEKMLYDNAILAETYGTASLFLGKERYRKIAEETISYILRSMVHPTGGFYSAEDSETHGIEGEFYTWRYDEVAQLIPEEDLHLFCDYFNIIPEGNYGGRSVINTPLSLEEFSAKHQRSEEEIEKIINKYKAMLWKIRETREHPFKDEKVICSWNGLMIHTLGVLGATFSNPSYLKAAAKGGQFIRDHFWEEGRLLRRWCDGEAKHLGILDDYAFMIRACLTLFEADLGTEWLVWALELNNVLEGEFKTENGAYHLTNGDDKNIILQQCQFSDGAEPSGNSVQAENLVKLYSLTGEEKYLFHAEDIFKAIEKQLSLYSPGYIYNILALYRYYDEESRLFVIALNEKEDLKDELFSLLYQNPLLHKMVVWRRENDERLFQAIPHLKDKGTVDGQTTLHICTRTFCQEPITEWEEMVSEVVENQ